MPRKLSPDKKRIASLVQMCNELNDTVLRLKKEQSRLEGKVEVYEDTEKKLVTRFDRREQQLLEEIEWLRATVRLLTIPENKMDELAKAIENERERRHHEHF